MSNPVLQRRSRRYLRRESASVSSVAAALLVGMEAGMVRVTAEAVATAEAVDTVPAGAVEATATEAAAGTVGKRRRRPSLRHTCHLHYH